MMRPQGALDFTAPEALQEFTQSSSSLDVFSYGGIILHVVNQEWPRPLHYIETDSKTGKLIGLSEVEQQHQQMKKLTECLGDLHLLVRRCLDNEQMKCPQIVANCGRKDEEYERGRDFDIIILM